MSFESCYDQNGNQISAGDGNPNSTAADQRLIEYAVHDKPLSVRTTGPNGRLTRYQYGPGREIVKRFDGPNATSTDTEVDYVGAMEVYYRPDQGTTTDRREYKRHLANYLVITLSSERQSGTVVRSSTRHYRFEEKLGSLDVLTDRNGTIVQRMSFDVWGERRNESTWGGYSQTQIAAFNSSNSRKGYTGHEHIDQANLIHMGGRVYDPRIGRFLSADPLVQAPNNTQSFNRYSYVINNPMNYVDPSGYSWLGDNWRTVASVAITAFAPYAWGVTTFAELTLTQAVITGMASGAVQSGTLKGALIGGFSAGMFHGIGTHFADLAHANHMASAAENYSGFAGTGLSGGQFVAKVAAHAAAGGVMNVLQGGKFGHGFASAGFGEAVSPAVSRFVGDSDLRQLMAGVVIGGTASKIAGGKFANGAVTGAFAWAFNHGMHESAGSGGTGGVSAEAFLTSESQNAGTLFCTTSCEATPDAAHAAAGDRYLGASIEARRETGWRVYDVGDGTFSFTYPTMGRKNSAQNALPARLPGLTHHSGGHAHWDHNNQFSPQDWTLITWGRRDGPGTTLYLASRNGRLQFSTPDHARGFAVTRGAAYNPPYGNFSGTEVSGVRLRTSYP